MSQNRRYILLFVLLLTLLILSNALVNAQDSAYQEAPALAAQVEAGTLPPVAERLPKNPLVVEPFDEIGAYGGTLRYPYIDKPDEIQVVAGWEYLTRWKTDMSGYDFNIAESIDINDDATQYTIHLREGMKWSDGQPFTADDILFAINDIWLNAELNPTPPAEVTLNGQPIVAEKVDDYTLTITYPAPYGLFRDMMAWWPGRRFTFFPKHWLEQYHMAYNPDGVKQMLAEGQPDSPWAGPIDSWPKLFAHYSLYANDWTMAEQSGRPVLGPWMVVQSRFEGDGQLILERNPYYWKVDSAGNQLPYIDRIVATRFEDYETLFLEALNGSFDSLKDPRIEDREFFLKSAEVAHLQVYDIPSDGAGTVSIHLNQTVTNAEKAAVYADKNFRIGLSYATDRQQITELVYSGKVTPRQLAPLESSPLYNEQLATQYLDYNLDLANEYLDKVLPNKDADGYRLLPSGEQMTVNFSVTGEYGLGFPQIAQLLALQWQPVGIAVTVEEITTDDRRARERNNDFEATIFTAEGGIGINAILDARYFVPIHNSSFYGLGWSLWYRFGANDEFAVEPPEQIKALFDLYGQVRAAADPDTRLELMQQVLQTAADGFFVMGISSPLDRYAVINDKIGNLPDIWYDGFVPGMQAATQHDQWYFKP